MDTQQHSINSDVFLLKGNGKSHRAILKRQYRVARRPVRLSAPFCPAIRKEICHAAACPILPQRHFCGRIAEYTRLDTEKMRALSLPASPRSDSRPQNRGVWQF
jgi:hypothetical protein